MFLLYAKYSQFVLLLLLNFFLIFLKCKNNVHFNFNFLCNKIYQFSKFYYKDTKLIKKF